MAAIIIPKQEGRNLTQISLTSFTDFVFKVGLPKVSKAAQIEAQYQAGYKQSHDYYKRFRDAVVAIHRQARPVHELDQLARVVPDAKGKKANYEHMIRGYKRFWASSLQEQDAVFVKPPKGTWNHHDVMIRINPELAFRAGPECYVFKLYLKKDEPTKRQAQIILHLMQLELRAKVEQPVFGLIDVRRGRLFEATAFDPRMAALVRGEAAAFAQMLKTLKSFEDFAADDE